MSQTWHDKWLMSGKSQVFFNQQQAIFLVHWAHSDIHSFKRLQSIMDKITTIWNSPTKSYFCRIPSKSSFWFLYIDISSNTACRTLKAFYQISCFIPELVSNVLCTNWFSVDTAEMRLTVMSYTEGNTYVKKRFFVLFIVRLPVALLCVCRCVFGIPKQESKWGGRWLVTNNGLQVCAGSHCTWMALVKS